MDYDHHQHQTYFLKTQAGNWQLAVKDIIYVKAEGCVSVFHLLEEANRPTVSKLLKQVEVELAPFGFLCISRDTLLNMRFVVLQYKNQLLLLNGEKLSVAVR
jgi:DNA-binding LytR/AlgR family response regulator